MLEYIKSFFAALISFFVMISGTGGETLKEIPETAPGTLAAGSPFLSEIAEYLRRPFDSLFIRQEPASVEETDLLSFAASSRSLPSGYTAQDNKIYKGLGYSYETAKEIATRIGGFSENGAKTILEKLYKAGYIQTVTRKVNNVKTPFYKRMPENLYITGAVISGDYIYVCGEGTRIVENNEAAAFSCSFVSKHSADGTLISCVETENSKTNMHYTGIAPSGDGGVTVCGYCESGTLYGDLYGFVKQFSPDIVETGFLKIYGEGNDSLTCISATPDGGFVVGGNTTSTTHDFDGIPDYGYSVAVLFKLNGELKKQWTRYLGGNGSCDVTDIDIDSSGNIFADISAIANDEDFAGFNGLLKNSLDNVIIKYDSSGLMKWKYVLSTNGRDYFDRVCADGNGGCVAGGNFSLTSGNVSVTAGTLKGLSLTGGSDIYIAGINSLGVKSWDRLIRGMSDDYLCSITKVRKGYVLTGYSDSYNGEFETNNGGYDGFADFISVSGEKTRIFTYGGEERDVASFALSDGNTAYVFGDIDTSSVDETSDPPSVIVTSEYFVGVYDSE